MVPTRPLPDHPITVARQPPDPLPTEPELVVHLDFADDARLEHRIKLPTGTA